MLWLLAKLGTDGSSVLAAVSVSTVMTVATVVPMGVTAINAEPSVDDTIDVAELAFPEPVYVSESAPPTPTASAAATPSPTPAPTPEPKDEPSPTPFVLAPFPTRTPPATATPGPTPTATPTARPTTSATPSPVPTASPSPTTRPTATPTPARPSTPRPTPTAVPATPTPRPTASPTPTPTSVPGADLRVLFSGGSSVERGTNSQVYLKVDNLGPGAASGVTVSFSISGGGSFRNVWPTAGWSCSGSGSSYTCTRSAMPAGTGGSMNVQFHAGQSGRVTLSASVSHTGTDPVSANNGASYSPTVIVVPTPEAEGDDG